MIIYRKYYRDRRRPKGEISVHTERDLSEQLS